MPQELNRVCASIFRNGRTGLEVTNLEDCLELRAIRVWVGARKHFNDEAAQRPNICLTGVRSLLDNLWSHPENRPLQRRAVPSTGAEHTAGFDALRNAKVRDFNSTFVIDKHICPFDVTMDDLTAMEICEASEDLADEVANERLLQGTVLVEKRSYGATRNILKKDVEVVLI